METAVLYFVLLVLSLAVVFNLVLTITISMVLAKMYEVMRAKEERELAQETKRAQARGLLDVSTPQNLI